MENFTLFQRPRGVACGRGHEPQNPLVLSRTSKPKPKFLRTSQLVQEWGALQGALGTGHHPVYKHLQCCFPASGKGRPRGPSRPPHHKGSSGGESVRPKWTPGGRRENRDSEVPKGAPRQEHPQWGDLLLQPPPVPSPTLPGLPLEVSRFTLLRGPHPEELGWSWLSLASLLQNLPATHRHLCRGQPCYSKLQLSPVNG